jgi:hypothetical protein
VQLTSQGSLLYGSKQQSSNDANKGDNQNRHEHLPMMRLFPHGNSLACLLSRSLACAAGVISGKIAKTSDRFQKKFFSLDFYFYKHGLSIDDDVFEFGRCKLGQQSTQLFVEDVFSDNY